MELIQNLHPESVDPSGHTDDFESPSPMDLSVTESHAHSLPAAVPRRQISAYENWKRLSTTFIASQVSRRMYTGGPYAVSGIGALIQAV